MLASISGGTDPGTSLGGSPILPIYAGEMRRGLGVKPCTRTTTPASRCSGQVGELVCARTIPSMPLYFWNDPGGKRYFESYFDTFPGPPNVWRHGDWLKLTPRVASP